MSQIIGIIPARYQSSRFPGKPLAKIKGKAMVQRTYEQSILAKGIAAAYVATDDERIYDFCKEKQIPVLMTDPAHTNGTERCRETLHLLPEKPDFIVNIQGDEPFIRPEQIEDLCNVLQHDTVQIATLVKKIEDQETLFNPNTPKVVLNKRQEAIYFSRQAIPYQRDAQPNEWLKGGISYYKHLGIYAYRSDVLEKIAKLEPCPLEETEKLEQLRWIYNGYSIKAGITAYETQGIDTPEDLERVNQN
jgi:3-deoxy-manno-octulosonate cytidylyltransferase (CMP-KDO synthetase)